MQEPETRVMVIAPHPDDAEIGCAGTIAKWIAESRKVIYVVCTNGDKGSNDPEMTSGRLARLREREQRQAAKLLGVAKVIFLDHPDGGLEDTPAFRGELVREIRRWRPEVVMSADPYYPYKGFVPHRDHRIAGMATLDAVYPYARDHLHYQEQLAEGLSTHKVMEVYLWGSGEPDTFIDISETFDIKLRALRCHTSQVGSMPQKEFEKRVRQMAARMGEKASLPLAEAFRRIELRR